MSKKKAIKLVAASAIAASSFAAVAPTQADAATSVSTLVSNASKTSKAAYDKYFKASSYVKTGTMDSYIKKAKDAVAKAEKAVKSYKGSKKKAYEAALKTAKGQIAKAEGYRKGAHEAYGASKKLATTAADLEKALVAGADFTKVGADLATFKADLAKAKKAIKDTIYGANAEKIVYAKYTVALDAKAKALDEKYAYLTAVPAVASVSATNNTTLTITGTDLHNLKADQITVEGNTVTSVTASADSKSATVVLGSKLGLNNERKVTVKIKEETKEYTVKYAYGVTNVEVTTTQVDDDADAQEISFNVNGVAADLDFLVNEAGYQVEFQASKAVFATGGPAATTSLTGELDEAAAAIAINEKFSVKVVLTKGGEVFASEWKEVSVKNLNATPEIGSLEVTNYGVDRLTGAGNSADDFIMKSSTLVAGENAKITSVLSKTEDPIVVTGGFQFKSSNVGVATVDANGVINAVAPGTATITVTAGLQTYTQTITVAGTARTVKTLTPAKSSYTVGKNTTGYKVSVTAKDQYGDPIAVAGTDAVVTETSTLNVTELTADTTGAGSLTVDAGTVAGTYPVYLKVGGVTLSSFNVVVTNDTVLASTKIESSDDALDLGGDNDTVVKVNQYTTAGGFIESLVSSTGLAQVAGTNVTLENAANDAYTLSVQDTTVATVAVDATSNVTVAGLATGTTKLVLKDSNNVDVAYFTVTVTDSTVSVSSITWKNPGTLASVGKEVKLGDALTLTAVTGDDIVSGFNLSKSTTSKVRVDEDNDAGSTTGIKVYLDTDDDADYTAGTDIVLGEVTAKVDPAFAQTAAALTVDTVNFDDWTTGAAHTGVFSRALAAGDKGNLIFTFTKRGTTVPFSSNVVNVEVK